MSTAPPRVAVFGYGRFGKAFVDLLQAGHSVQVFDPHAAVPTDLAASSLAAATTDATWIVLAMPVPHMRDALLALRPLLHAGQTVLDVGSVKLHPCAMLDELLGADLPHVGTHPLFGPLSLARDERPRRVVICPALDHPQAAARAGELFRALSCEVIVQSPQDHDRAMARTHALAFFVAKGLIDMGVDEGMPMAPPSFQSMKRMLEAVRGDAGHLFGAIQSENPFAAEAREELMRELDRIHRQLLADTDDSMAIAARSGRD